MFEFRNPEEEAKTLEDMEQYGGSFVKALVVCYMTADSFNKGRILAGFGHYFKHYALGHKEELIEKKPDVEIKLSMSDAEVEHGHHVSVNVRGSKIAAEHLFMHLLSDGKNEIGAIMRSIMKKGIPMPESEAREVLGDDIVDYVKHKAEKEPEENEPKLPN